MIKQLPKILTSVLVLIHCLLAGCSSLHYGNSLPAPMVEQPQRVALLLPLRGQYAASAQAIRNGFLAAYYYDKQRNPNVPSVTVIDVSDNVQTAYQQAISGGANFIVGPLTKPQVEALARENQLQVPTLALNTIGDQRTPNNLYQFGLSPVYEADQAAQKAWQDGHHNAIIIAQAGPWGQSIANAFANRWQQLGGQIVANLDFTPRQDISSAIGNLLQVDKSVVSSKGFKQALKDKIPLNEMRRQDFDVVFLVALPQQARLIKPLLKFYFAGDIPVYATSSIYGGTPSPQYDRDLNGIIFPDMPWVLDTPNQLPSGIGTIQSNIVTLWPKSYTSYPKLYAFGIDAYNLVGDLNQLAGAPQSGIGGATGTLYLGPQHQIYRQLQWAQMRNGVPASL